MKNILPIFYHSAKSGTILPACTILCKKPPPEVPIEVYIMTYFAGVRYFGTMRASSPPPLKGAASVGADVHIRPPGRHQNCTDMMPSSTST